MTMRSQVLKTLAVGLLAGGAMLLTGCEQSGTTPSTPRDTPGTGNSGVTNGSSGTMNRNNTGAGTTTDDGMGGASGTQPTNPPPRSPG